MSTPSQRGAGWTAGILPKSKRVLMASVLALGVTGGLIGHATLIQSTPALAATAMLQGAPFSFADLVEKVRPAVVSIRVKSASKPQVSYFEGFPDFPDGHPLERFFRRFGEPDRDLFGERRGKRFGDRRNRRQRRPYATAQGSGFIISADGYIVTNNHVVDNASEVTVTLEGGKTYTAKVIGSDKKTDLALVKIEENGGFPYVSFAKKDVRVGDWVVAVGNPFGLGGSVTAGIVSARGRDIGAGPYDDFLQIDAPINRGNSGGPTFDLDGNVVGVNTAIFSPSGGSVGIGFAIPASTANQIIEDLKDDGQVVRGWLGVHIQNVNDEIAESLGLSEAEGALVAEAQSGSPANRAGIKSGDVVVAVDGTKIDSSKELARKIAGYAPKTKVAVTLWRDGKTKNVVVTLGKLPTGDKEVSVNKRRDRPEPTSLQELGLAVAPASETGAGDAGVVVTAIDSSSEAASRGLRVGDVILEVGGHTVDSARDVVDALSSIKETGRKAALLRIQSGGASRFVALPIDRG